MISEYDYRRVFSVITSAEMKLAVLRFEIDLLETRIMRVPIQDHMYKIFIHQVDDILPTNIS